jgi:hypothetical protein
VVRKKIAGLGIAIAALDAVSGAWTTASAPWARLEETMSVPRPLFGPATLPVSETKSALQQLIERAQLEILYRHPR